MTEEEIARERERDRRPKAKSQSGGFLIQHFHIHCNGDDAGL
jgi:hypothetical protein